MITTKAKAAAVQIRRREQGLKGRSKAVRRWFRREYGLPSIEGHGTCLPEGLRANLDADFEGCRSYEETYFSGE